MTQTDNLNASNDGRADVTVVAVYASDWGTFGDQVTRDHEFAFVRGWVYGELVAEDADKLVVAHHAFDDDGLRHVTILPKVNVLRRLDWVRENGESSPPT